MENFLLVGQFSFKNTKIVTAIPPFWRKLQKKVEILSSHDLLCRTFAAVYRKIATSCPVQLFKPTTPSAGVKIVKWNWQNVNTPQPHA